MIQNRQLNLRIESARMKLKILQFRIALLHDPIDLKEFNPNQARNPAGQSDGGRWVGRDGGAGKDSQNTPLKNIRFVSLRKHTQEYCAEQYKRDAFHCRMVGLRSCYAQAMVRRVACEQGHPVPPLNY